jgi:hypothetical protein
MSVIEKFETRERGLPQALMAAKLIEEMRAALEAAPALPLAAPVTDDEIDAAFDELGMACQSTTAEEMRRVLGGFAAGRAAGVEPAVQEGYRIVPIAKLAAWKSAVNETAARSIKAERWSYGASLKQSIADVINAAPQPAPKP